MLDCRYFKALSLSCLVLFLAGCGSAGLNSIAIAPSTQVLNSVGATVQFTAIGTYVQGSHPPSTQDITSQVAWSSSNAAVATVSSSGLATAVAPGNVNITASMNGFGGVKSSTAAVTVTGGGTVGSNLTSLTILPGSQPVGTVNETGQFIAIGTYTDESGAKVAEDVTSQVAWSSSDVKVATINTTGLATGINTGQTTIVAIASAPNGVVTTATATFTVGLIVGNGTQLATLTIYKVGNNAGIGTVSSPGTNPANVINCGTGAGCVGNFPIGSTVTLTEAPGASTFGGWSANCAITPGMPNLSNTCTLVLTDNDTVGAIFN